MTCSLSPSDNYVTCPYVFLKAMCRVVLIVLPDGDNRVLNDVAAGVF